MWRPERWEDGDAGESWKSRSLSEKRENALNFLFDVSRRRPLTEAMRKQAKRNEERLRMRTSSDPTETPPVDQAGASDTLVTALTPLIHEGGDDAHDVDGGLDWADIETLVSEGVEGTDVLRNIPQRDIEALFDELYGGVAADAQARQEKLLREWFRLRREQSDTRNFDGMPPEERKLWSAWYLRSTRYVAWDCGDRRRPRVCLC